MVKGKAVNCIFIIVLQQSVLQQRNRILQDALKDQSLLDTLDIWSDQLAEEAATISRLRAEYVERANGFVRDIFSDMTDGRELPELIYTGERSKEDFMKKLTENVMREMYYGATMFGTHKDDITVLLNGKEARSYASQGQQRSLSLAMKLAEGEISREDSGEYPVFLFDDVLSELDTQRKQYVIAGLTRRQVIITTCERDIFPKDSYQINVKDGRFYQ